MQKRIATISREFGSGGRSIGRLVARQLGVAFYDKELVKKIALETGFDEQYVEQESEDAPNKNWFAYAFSTRGTQGAMNSMSTEDFLWAMQNKLIHQLAEKGPCVIVGRCADYILRERDDCFHVFVHADLGTRAQRIVRLYGESEKSPEKRLEEKDRKRRLYYRHYTDREWGMSQNYHLSLDSGLIGVEPCADLIVRLVRAL